MRTHGNFFPTLYSCPFQKSLTETLTVFFIWLNIRRFSTISRPLTHAPLLLLLPCVPLDDEGFNKWNTKRTWHRRESKRLHRCDTYYWETEALLGILIFVNEGPTQPSQYFPLNRHHPIRIANLGHLYLHGGTRNIQPTRFVKQKFRSPPAPFSFR